MRWWEIDLWLEWNTSCLHLSNFPNNLINSNFLILQSFWTAASETQPFAFFAIRRSFFFVFSRYLEALIRSSSSGSETGAKCVICSRWRNFMLLFFNLRAKFDQLTFPVFSLSQLGDFRTTKSQFQSKNMLVNNDIMSFLEFIRFIINRKSTAFRLILDCPWMLIGSLELLIGICVFSKLNRVVMGG